MDSEFDRRWRLASAPFDGVTVYLEDYVPLADLREMLIPIVEILYAHDPEAKLFRLSDWHDHDGYVNEAVPAAWQELRSLLASEDALKAASTGETYVRTVFFPEQRDFLLRLYVPASYDNPFHTHDDPHLIHYGHFDVTSQEPLVLQARDAILKMGGTAVETMPAKAFFDRSYSG